MRDITATRASTHMAARRMAGKVVGEEASPRHTAFRARRFCHNCPLRTC
jgi:hypothetical protein